MVVKPSDSAYAQAQIWRLGLVPAPPSGRAGEYLGRGTGSSIEFQDRRIYAPGDDVRHLDWRAFARTGQLTVKLYREELLPRLDLLLDVSASMSVGDDKPGLAIDLAAFLCSCARRQGFAVRLIELSDEPRLADLEAFRVEGSPLAGRYPLSVTADAAEGFLRPGTLRVLISDFLSPHDAPRLVRALAARAGGLALIQVLSREDAEPPVGAAFRMEDAETGEEREIVLDATTVDEYLGRLRRLNEALETECRRAAARFLRLVVEEGQGIAEVCRDHLARAGIVVPD